MDNSNIQIVALKQGTRSWVRIDGQAKICDDKSLKQKMLKECPILTKRYSSPEDENFALIQVAIDNYEMFQ